MLYLLRQTWDGLGEAQLATQFGDVADHEPIRMVEPVDDPARPFMHMAQHGEIGPSLRQGRRGRQQLEKDFGRLGSKPIEQRHGLGPARPRHHGTRQRLLRRTG